MPEEQIVIAVDSQELNSMDLCPERWRLEHVEHWRKKKKPKYLDRGAIMHAMLAHYYRSRKDQYNKEGKLVRPARLEPKDQYAIIQECLALGRFMIAGTQIPVEEFEEEDIRVFKDYILFWQRDGWEIISIESPFSVILYESPRLKIYYQGVIDLIVIDPKLGRIVVDTKTEQRKSNPYVLSNQFQGYEWASGLKVVINKIGYQQDSTPIEQRFRRLVHESQPEVLEEWRTDTIKQVIIGLGWLQDVEAGKRLRKNRTSCDKYAGCVFQPVCKEPSEVREHLLMVNFYKKKWDPFTRDENELSQTELERLTEEVSV